MEPTLWVYRAEGEIEVLSLRRPVVCLCIEGGKLAVHYGDFVYDVGPKDTVYGNGDRKYF